MLPLPPAPWRILPVVLSLGLAACGGVDTAVDVEIEPAAFLSVIPTGGATNVDRSAPIIVTFDHSIMSGMEAYADVHKGDLTGPEVPGAWTMAPDRTSMTFQPANTLDPSTMYTIHLGGAMMGADGGPVDLETHGSHRGGSWATSTMMGGAMNGSPSGTHAGDGWRHSSNGSYGMAFTFTTGV